MAKKLCREDIMDREAYGATRKERRRAVTQMKKNRRLGIGPDATCYFENYDTMVHQIHEMLFIEKGGPEQIDDELSAYGPLVPNGRELVATLMFEVDDPARRARLLHGLGGVEETVSIAIGEDVILAVPEQDVDRSTADGKASAIQFLHFPFTDQQVAVFRDLENRVVVGIGHAKYGHMAIMPDSVRQALAQDFD